MAGRTDKPRKPQDQGSYPGAHPTAPGGMSQKQLVDELLRDTDMTEVEASALIWREQIEAVIASRQAVEARYKALHETGAVVEFSPDSHASPEPGVSEPSDTEEADADLWADDADDLGDDDGEYLIAPVMGDDPTVEDIEVDLDIEAEMVSLAEARAAHEQAVQATKPPSLFLGMPDTLDYRFDNHAGAGPSGAERWMNCTASLGASRKFLETLSPNQQAQFARSGDAARQGTTAHAAAEVEVGVIMGTITPEEAEHTLLELTIMPDTEDEAYDSEMAEHIAEYVDLVQTYLDAGHKVLVEQRVEAAVPLTDLHEGEVYVVTGSGDFVALPIPTDKTLTVGDLKYGNGIDVDVDQNPQVRIYALGALSLLADEDGNLPDLDKVEYHIIQPRLGGIKTWSESVNDLLTWRDEVLAPALTAALYGTDEGAVYAPSELACQWCPARGGCAALTEQRVEQAADLFDSVVEAEFAGHDIADGFPETGALSNERLGVLLAQVEGLIAIKDDLKEEAQRRLHRGDAIPGYQLVSYTPPRKWTESAMQEIEHNEELPALWKPKALLTPKQALTLLGENAGLIEDLIDTPDKRPVVAKNGDRRKTWTGTPPEQMFADESGTEEVA